MLVILVGLGGSTDLAYVSLKSRADALQATLTNDLQTGQQKLEAGKEALKQANSKHDIGLVNEAITDFAAAKASFDSASGTADNSQFLRYLQYVPNIGSLARSRHAAVDGIAQMGASISDAGEILSQLDGDLIKPTSAGEVGRTLLTVLNQVNTGLVTVQADLEAAKQAGAQVDLRVLPANQQASFAKARATIDSALTGFTEFQRLYPVLTEVLGGNGARRYLVEQVNPAELRTGGGFIGTYSLLQADHGALSVIQSGDAYTIINRAAPGRPGFIPQPTPLREIIPNVPWSFVDSNIYPDFPSNAQAAENFVQPTIGHVDGVISMDYYVVAAMLQLTGPLDVPGYGLQVDSNNFVAQAMRHDVAGDAAHKAILSAFAGPLMARVSSLPPERWPDLLTLLNGQASEKHLQVYLNNATAEAEIDRVGWSGRLNTSTNAEFLMEVEANYGGTKSNYWVTREHTVALSRSGSLLHHNIVVRITNNEPCGIEAFTLYRANVRLFVSASATNLVDNLQADRYPNPAPPAGTKAFDGWIYVACGGGHNQATFTYDTPWPAQDKNGWEIYWQKQSGTMMDGASVSWYYGSGGTQTATGNLGQDDAITLLPKGLGFKPALPAAATLPSLSF